jgi:galactofuranosylgalactofuranosylrhamnosyl-N-acetylglucosaminyl-diphospho-decaprenol beta-1,5/1,6-galactofuranosyltransferase
MVGRLARVRGLGAHFTEARVMRAAEELPRFPAREIRSVTSGTIDPGPRGLGFVRWLLGVVWRHSMTRPSGTDAPKAHLPYQDARWFQVPEHDSVLITNAEGSGVTWHVRDRRTFRRMLAESVRLNLRYRRDWAALSRKYRKALPQITSIDAWARSLGQDG